MRWMGRSRMSATDLAPQIGRGSPADEPHDVEPLADESLDVRQQPAEIERHSLHHGPGRLSPGRPQRLVEESAADVSIGGRRPRAVEPRQKQQPVAAGRDAGRLCEELVVRLGPLGRVGKVPVGKQPPLRHRLQTAARRPLLGDDDVSPWNGRRHRGDRAQRLHFLNGMWQLSQEVVPTEM